MDHDQRLKVLLRVFLLDLLRLVVPAWADRFLLAGIEWLEQEVFPDPPHGERRAVDMVARVPLSEALESPWGKEVRQMLLHVEAESRDAVAQLRPRLWEYNRHLVHKHGLPVLSLAVYMRVALQGIGWDRYVRKVWGEEQEVFRWPYAGLPALDAWRYAQGDNWLAVALVGLMACPEARRAELKAEALQRVATSPHDPLPRYLLADCLEAYLPLEGPHLAAYNHLLLTERYKEARMLGQTSYERGLEEGQRGLIRRQLERLFGPLTALARQRLEAYPVERLAELGEKVLTAESLADLGLEDPSALPPPL